MATELTDMVIEMDSATTEMDTAEALEAAEDTEAVIGQAMGSPTV